MQSGNHIVIGQLDVGKVFVILRYGDSETRSGIFFFQAEDGILYPLVTGVQTCALPI